MSECGAKISIQFSRPGDFVTCHSCGAKNPVPELGQEPAITDKPDFAVRTVRSARKRGSDHRPAN